MIDENVQESMPAVLSASVWSGDHRRLAGLLGKSKPCPLLFTAQCVEQAIAIVRRQRIHVAIVDRDLPGGGWRRLLDNTLQLLPAPLLIVTSTHADEYLWAEALNLGAFDVLAKPFDATEAKRVIAWACLRALDKSRSAAGRYTPLKEVLSLNGRRQVACGEV